jgi:hypothetical protein
MKTDRPALDALARSARALLTDPDAAHEALPQSQALRARHPGPSEVAASRPIERWPIPRYPRIPRPIQIRLIRVIRGQIDPCHPWARRSV